MNVFDVDEKESWDYQGANQDRLLKYTGNIIQFNFSLHRMIIFIGIFKLATGNSPRLDISIMSDNLTE